MAQRAVAKTAAPRRSAAKAAARTSTAPGRAGAAAATGGGPGEGDRAPAFTLETGDGRTISLSDYAGKQSVVLYFYPKDMTSGCTAEACAFRDNYARIRKAGAEILGVSMDSPALHAKFTDKYTLPFPLLADVGGAICKAYGVYKEKSMYGRKFWGIERSTFVIGPDGKIRRAWRKVKVGGHEQDVLDALTG